MSHQNYHHIKVYIFVANQYHIIPDGLYGLLVGESMGCIGCSSPSSKFDFMWYFLAGVLGDAELALDSFGEDAIETDDRSDDVSEKTESELHPPPGAFSTLKNEMICYFKSISSILIRNRYAF